MDNNFLFLCGLATGNFGKREYSAILYMCSGKYNDIYF